MTLTESIGPSPVVSIPDNFEGTNTYAATWDAISEVVNVKDQQSVVMLRAVAEQLDALDATQLDRSRLEDILRRLDEITTPDAPVLPSEPSAGALNYTPVALPAIDTRRASLPGAPALRQLMDIGPAPNIDEAGQAMSIDEFRDILVRERDDLLTLVRSGFDDFLTRFMPVGAIMDSAFTWLDEALNARSTGIPVHVEAQIFERHRARVDKEATRLINTAVGSWAAKGYVLPPGALAGQVAQIRRDHADQLATSSREVAIYVTDKHIENARFAIEQMLAVRNQALSLASDYMRMLLTTPGEAGSWMTAVLDNKTKLVGARVDVYRTRAGVASDVFRAQSGVDVELYKASADVELENTKVDNGTTLDRFRAALEQDKNRFTAGIEEFKARSGSSTEVYKALVDGLMRYYETSARVSGLKADTLSKTADASLRIQDSQINRDTQNARLKVDAAIEMLKMYAQQVSAAMNNLQLQSNSSYNLNESRRLDDGS